LWAPNRDFELHVTFKCPSQAQVVLSYLLDDAFHDNYRVQRQVLTAAPGPRKRTTGSHAPQSEGLVCVFDITSTESEANPVRQPGIRRALSLAPERELLNRHECKISLMTGGGEKR
jgi:hypothetical protein